jgi:hypothetical protein
MGTKNTTNSITYAFFPKLGIHYTKKFPQLIIAITLIVSGKLAIVENIVRN